MSSQRFAPEFKDEAVRQVLERGYPVTEVAQRLGVSAHSLYKWIKAVKPLQRAITLEECKVIPGLEKMVLVNNTRLSVQPVSAEEWAIICRLGGVEP